MKLKEHIKPHKFVYKLDEPLPAKKNIEDMLRIKDRGAEVVFREPKWYSELKEDFRPVEMYFYSF